MRFSTTPEGLHVDVPAKLNLYLEVYDVEPNGFHPIDSLFQAIDLYDRLDLVRRDDDEITIDDGVVGVGEKNLVYRAAARLREHVGGDVPCGVHLRLEKGIPHGAGLGGGSSDAAATLLGLDALWKLGVPRSELEELGSELGSDVPFFFHGGTARCQGRGEILTTYHETFDAVPCHYVLVCPGIEVSTGKVYGDLDRRRDAGELARLTPPSGVDSMNSASWLSRFETGELFFNRLEEVACGLVEELRELGLRLKKERFRAVLMSGSGSTFYGVCSSAAEARELADRVQYDNASMTVLAATSLPGWSESP